MRFTAASLRAHSHSNRVGLRWRAHEVCASSDSLILENDRGMQRKVIKFKHLVANCLIFYNAAPLSSILKELALEGREFAGTLHFTPRARSQSLIC